jgi:hypothetical protein
VLEWLFFAGDDLRAVALGNGAKDGDSQMWGSWQWRCLQFFKIQIVGLDT